MVLLIDALAAAISCAVVVLNARTAVRVETRASLATVESLVADTIRLSDTAPPDTLLQTLDVRFQALRHVRVTVLDAEGNRWLGTAGQGLWRLTDAHVTHFALPAGQNPVALGYAPSQQGLVGGTAAGRLLQLTPTLPTPPKATMRLPLLRPPPRRRRRARLVLPSPPLPLQQHRRLSPSL